MSLHSINRHSDPRVTCGLLAKDVWNNFENQADEDDRDIFVTKLIRLLEMYRYDRFVTRKPKGVLVRGTKKTQRENKND